MLAAAGSRRAAQLASKSPGLKIGNFTQQKQTFLKRGWDLTPYHIYYTGIYVNIYIYNLAIIQRICLSLSLYIYICTIEMYRWVMRLIHNSGTPQDHWVNSHSYALLIMSFAGIIYGHLGYIILPSPQPISSISHYIQRTLCRDTSHAPLDIMDVPAVVVFFSEIPSQLVAFVHQICTTLTS